MNILYLHGWWHRLQTSVKWKGGRVVVLYSHENGIFWGCCINSDFFYVFFVLRLRESINLTRQLFFCSFWSTRPWRSAHLVGCNDENNNRVNFVTINNDQQWSLEQHLHDSRINWIEQTLFSAWNDGFWSLSSFFSHKSAKKKIQVFVKVRTCVSHFLRSNACVHCQTTCAHASTHCATR